MFCSLSLPSCLNHHMPLLFFYVTYPPCLHLQRRRGRGTAIRGRARGERGQADRHSISQANSQTAQQSGHLFFLPGSSLLSRAWGIFGSISSGHLLQRVPQTLFPPPLQIDGRQNDRPRNDQAAFATFMRAREKLLLLAAEALSYHATLLSASSISGVLGTRCQS